MSSYQTQGNISIHIETNELPYANAMDFLIDEIDSQRGAIYSSNFEYPGRYTRWDIGFVNPPIVIVAKALAFTVSALNERGKILLPAIHNAIKNLEAVNDLIKHDNEISGGIALSTKRLPEELRSKQPTLFSVIRAIINLFKYTDEEHLGLYGAFAYDLVFQFEQLQKKLAREEDQRDLVLYLPDELYIVDHRRKQALCKQYDFSFNGDSTKNIDRTGDKIPYQAFRSTDKKGDHTPGEYAGIVDVAKQKFKKGDLFEVVPGQTFFENCPESPSEIFRRLQQSNPSPYGFMINLGEGEYLVGASPEMYVKVRRKRVETGPISGTIKRGKDAISDANNILALLNSKKDESELTMCTDVDRNDKSRICVPGSVKVIGRRQIEMYSRLIHTVDHVEAELREGYDALDAFLSHMWVVTVTGAPKLWAMQFIEDHEKSPRRWYAGSVGWLGFDGNMNTGLTLRTIRIKEGIAEIRAGATLLYDSDPAAEEQETQLKASAFIDAIRRPRTTREIKEEPAIPKVAANKHILLVDYQDSFVHTLANYFQQTGAKITTYRNDFSETELAEINPDLIVLSPGPGRPQDFDTSRAIELALKHNLPIFGVCLGLQALVEYFGGELGVLDYPMHGKSSKINHHNGILFKDIPSEFTVGRYHSLYAVKNKLPKDLNVTAVSEDGIIMAIEHHVLPIAAVQFHPESILSLENDVGLKIIANVIESLC